MGLQPGSSQPYAANAIFTRWKQFGALTSNLTFFAVLAPTCKHDSLVIIGEYCFGADFSRPLIVPLTYDDPALSCFDPN